MNPNESQFEMEWKGMEKKGNGQEVRILTEPVSFHKGTDFFFFFFPFFFFFFPLIESI